MAKMPIVVALVPVRHARIEAGLIGLVGQHGED